ncbi:MAG: hypothetical protein V3R96_06415, partial [Dehalococcoidales bacterium]
LIPELASQGKTVLLTTHYMLEADTLCQTVAMINKGKLVALGSPAEIKGRLSNVDIIEVTVKESGKSLIDELGKLDGVKRVDLGVDGILQKITVHVSLGLDLQEQVAAIADQAGIENIVSRQPTLEEAYLNILK